MKIALIDSGLGLLAAAAALRGLRPDADLVLSSDPDGMPWGPRSPEDTAARARIAARARTVALAAAAEGPDALIVACNTASVHALETLRAALEPALPVVGTVPAVKPAAAAGGPIAVWATPATTGSPYQRRLLGEFAAGVRAAEVPCHGLADAIERADEAAVGAAVDAAARLTPPGTRAVVLGCTHYELAAPLIRERLAAALGAPVTLHGSARAVAAQALRRLGAEPDPAAAPAGGLTVLASGRPALLPGAARRYPEGRLLLSGHTALAPAGRTRRSKAP